jgi:hypothetical protein
MLNKPGVQVYLHGDKSYAKTFTSKAFKVLNDYQRAAHAQDTRLTQDKLTRIIDGGAAKVQVNFHHGQAEIHIWAQQAQQQVEAEQEFEEKLREEELEEEIEYIRLYLHADVILKTDWATRYSSQMVRDDIVSVLVTGIWDQENSVLDGEPEFAVIPKINMGTESGEWAGVWQRGVSIDQVLDYYEIQLPSKYGKGTVSRPLNSLDFFATREQCAYDEGLQPWESYLTPIFIHGELMPDSYDSFKQTPTAGCCEDVYTEWQGSPSVNYFWIFASNIRVTRQTDGIYGCDDIAKFGSIGFTGYDQAWAFRSQVYGQIYNGALKNPQVDDIDAWFFQFGPHNMNTALSSGGLIVNGTTWDDPSQYNDYGFSPSWQLESGLAYYGEAFSAHVIQAVGNPVTNYAAVTITNLHSSIGEGLDVFDLKTSVALPNDATDSATSIWKQMLEIAVTEAGGTLYNPTTLDNRLNSNDIIWFGHENVDIRTLPGTVASSLLYDLHMFAAPMKVKRKLLPTIVQESMKHG